MAKTSCVVKMGRFKWDRAGYAAVANSPGVQALLADKASVVKARADAGLKGSNGHYVKQFRGRLAQGYVVGAQTFEARYAQAKRKHLTKALNSIGGGG